MAPFVALAAGPDQLSRGAASPATSTPRVWVTRSVGRVLGQSRRVRVADQDDASRRPRAARSGRSDSASAASYGRTVRAPGRRAAGRSAAASTRSSPAGDQRNERIGLGGDQAGEVGAHRRKRQHDGRRRACGCRRIGRTVTTTRCVERRPGRPPPRSRAARSRSASATAAAPTRCRPARRRARRPGSSRSSRPSSRSSRPTARPARRSRRRRGEQRREPSRRSWSASRSVGVVTPQDAPSPFSPRLKTIVITRPGIIDRNDRAGGSSNHRTDAGRRCSRPRRSRRSQ